MLLYTCLPTSLPPYRQHAGYLPCDCSTAKSMVEDCRWVQWQREGFAGPTSGMDRRLMRF
ncbi:predicted protein [Botrytis cinerea T4]|uniref:Uncharacterized protein n=1 Tax=Botryotinia fuckeliana (strain T4) TaxID=999810 RepID=G2Y0Y5_BOTF4|nr:predicted protein [Botrytis cinerea T4]